MRNDLALKNDKKIIFLVLDGAGNIPNPQFSYRTPLKAAQKPSINRLATGSGILD
jgi:2,3-bisphosphoglycerate-independent phosphoglycerate mutase